MKIRFLEDTYIRRSPAATKGELPLGTVFKGAELEVAQEAVKGESIQQNNKWYRDKNGWYYWSGRAEAVEELSLPATPGGTLGGIMVAPAPTDVATAIPPAAPPLANDDMRMQQEEIPAGETRSVPPLEALLAAENQPQRRGLPNPPPEPASHTPALAAAQAAPVEGPADAPPEAEPADLWCTPDPQKINWGIRNNRIDREWWIQRRITGRGIRLAILSTGVPAGHPDLPNVADTFCWGGETAPMADRHGMGTQAAVVAAGIGHLAFGVAPEAALLVGKIGEQDYLLRPEGLIAGLEWAIDANADVVAMLVDFAEMDGEAAEALKALVDRAVRRGILLVAPAGTHENKKPESRFPAQMAGVLSVGAHDLYGQRCHFSARSYDLDLLAPGEGLLTASPQQTAVWNLKSCSAAAAFTAGLLALVRQCLRAHDQEPAPEAVYDLLRNSATARRAFNKGEDVEYGYGILNAVEVLKTLPPPSTIGV